MRIKKKRKKNPRLSVLVKKRRRTDDLDGENAESFRSDVVHMLGRRQKQVGLRGRSQYQAGGAVESVTCKRCL